jgi:RHS repeat-associated protein
VKATFIYGLHANVPEYLVQGTSTYRLITDQVGSVRLVVNTSTGAVAQRIDYDEFGNVLSDTAPGTQPFGFAGGLRDLDTGLTRFGARDYDPVTGRWTEKDPVGFEGGLNFYEYAANDPINFVDPTGLIVRFGDAAGRRLWGVVRAVPEGESISDYLESSPNEYVIYGNASLPGTAAGATGDLAGENGHFRRGANTCPSGLSVDLRIDSNKSRQALRGGPGIPGPAGRLAHEMLHAALLDFKTTGAPLPTGFLENLLPGSGPNGELGEIEHRLVDWWSIQNWGRK